METTQLMNESTKHGRAVQRKRTQLYKEWGSDTCYNMDEPGNHHIKQKKPDVKGHMMCDSIPVKCLE